MTTAVSSDIDTIKDALWQGVQQLTKGEEIYQKTLCNLEAKRNEQAPHSKNPAFQEELNKTHAVYQKWIEASILNTKAQSAIEQELKALFERKLDLFALHNSLVEIQSRLNPLLLQHKGNEAEIKKLEDRIVELMDHPT
ncbi:MAG TPA: hypothetical protein VIJ14_02625 [Rhabdochlamydiaceae bacterium]